jgi:uncharacterized damage-inducible protein DinB
MPTQPSSSTRSAVVACAALLARQLRHAAWANAQVLGVLNTQASARQPDAIRLFGHLLAAERVWLLRLRGEDSAVQAVWPRWSLEELNAFVFGNALGYERFLDALSDDDLSREVAYANTRGEAFRTVVADVLAHVALHGSYHRGQVAAVIRDAGAEPVNTDFITWARQGSPVLRAVPGWDR